MSQKLTDVQELESLLAQEEERRIKVQQLFNKKKEEEKEAKLKRAQQRTLTHGEREEIRKVFELFDKDQSGRIKGTELLEVSRSLGCELTPTELNETIATVDRDKDKELDFEEFLSWWGSDKLLGGNKGVKLRLLRTRLAARMAKNGALEKLRSIGQTELGGRNINLESDILTGKIPENWKPAVEVHTTVLPLSKEAFGLEGKRWVKAFQEDSDLDKREDFWDGGEKGMRFEEEAIKGLVKVTCLLRPEVTKERANELLCKYNEMKNDLKGSGFEIEGESLLPNVRFVTRKQKKDGKDREVLMMEALCPMRYAKPLTQIIAIANETLRLGNSEETVEDNPEKVFESIAFSFKNDMDPLSWLLDEENGVAQLFSRFQVTTKATFSRAMLQLYQSYIFSSPVSHDYYRDVFASAAGQMILLAMAGGASVRLKLRSFGEVVEEIGTSFGKLHEEFINRQVQEGEIETSAKLAALLSSKEIVQHWQARLRYLTRNMTAKEALSLGRTTLGGMTQDNEEMSNHAFGAIREAVLAPVRVQFLSPVCSANATLKGFEFVSNHVPADAAEGKKWIEENDLVYQDIESALEKMRTQGRKLYDIADFYSDGWKVGKVSRRIVVAGMPGSGKSTLVHRASTGLGLEDPTPTERLAIKNTSYKGRIYPTWEYWDAPTGFSSLPEFMLDEEAMSGPITLVWVVDTTVGIQPGEREAFQRLKEVFETDNLHIVLALGKSDLKASESWEGDIETAAKAGIVDRETVHQLGKCLTTLSVTGTQYDSAQRLLDAVRKMERHAAKGEAANACSERADSSEDEGFGDGQQVPSDEDDEWFD